MSLLEKTNIVLLVLLLISLLYIAYIFYDGETKWIDVVNLIVNISGSIVLVGIIWYISSYKADKIKDEESKIKIINCIYGDLFGLSNLIVDITNKMTSLERLNYYAVLHIEENINSFNNRDYMNAFSKRDSFPVCDFSLKYSERDITFISLNSPQLYENLFQLEDISKQFGLSVKIYKENIYHNSKYKLDVMAEGKSNAEYENKKLNLVTHSAYIERGFRDSARISCENFVNQLYQAISIFKIAIDELDKYVDENFHNKVSLRNYNRDIFFKKILEFRNEHELAESILNNLQPDSRNLKKVSDDLKEYNERFCPNSLIRLFNIFANILNNDFKRAKFCIEEYSKIIDNFEIVVDNASISKINQILPDINSIINNLDAPEEQSYFRKAIDAMVKQQNL